MSPTNKEESNNYHNTHYPSDSNKKELDELIQTLSVLNKTAGKEAISITPTLKSTLATTLEFLHCQAEADWHLRAYKQAENQSRKYFKELEIFHELSSEIGQLCNDYKDTSADTAAPTEDTEIPNIAKLFEDMRGVLKNTADTDVAETEHSQYRSEPDHTVEVELPHEFSQHATQTPHDSTHPIGVEETRTYQPEIRDNTPKTVSDTFLKTETPVDNNITILRTRADKDAPTENSDLSLHKDHAQLSFHCLGEFKAYLNHTRIEDWNGHKGILILKYLLLHAGKPVSKEKLMNVMWPFSDQESARRNLHQAIYSLRQTFRNRDPDHQYILFKQEKYLLNPAMNIRIDFVEFEKLIRAGKRLWQENQRTQAMDQFSQAITLYDGIFMEEELYEEWTDNKREQLQHLYLDILSSMAGYYLDKKDYSKAISHCQKILSQDDCNESAYRKLMRCYLEQDQRHLAMRQYQNCVQALKDNLGLPPSDKTQAYYKQITEAA